MVLLWKALCLFTTSSRPLLIRLHLEYKSFSWHPLKLTWRETKEACQAREEKYFAYFQYRGNTLEEDDADHVVNN